LHTVSHGGITGPENPISDVAQANRRWAASVSDTSDPKVSNGQIELVMLMHKMGASPTVPDEKKRTPYGLCLQVGSGPPNQQAER